MLKRKIGKYIRMSPVHEIEIPWLDKRTMYWNTTNCSFKNYLQEVVIVTILREHLKFGERGTNEYDFPSNKLWPFLTKFRLELSSLSELNNTGRMFEGIENKIW